MTEVYLGMRGPFSMAFSKLDKFYLFLLFVSFPQLPVLESSKLHQTPLDITDKVSLEWLVNM